jgi:hypothetical protein
MDVENTDLERRVLAHPQILQVLIAHMAEGESKFLDWLHKYSQNITHWALTSRTAPTRPDTQSSLSSKWHA